MPRWLRSSPLWESSYELPREKTRKPRARVQRFSCTLECGTFDTPVSILTRHTSNHSESLAFAPDIEHDSDGERWRPWQCKARLS